MRGFFSITLSCLKFDPSSHPNYFVKNYGLMSRANRPVQWVGLMSRPSGHLYMGRKTSPSLPHWITRLSMVP